LKRSAVVAVVVVGALLGACGGSSPSGSTGASSTSTAPVSSPSAAMRALSSDVAGTVNELAIASQTRSPTAFQNLQNECRLDQPLVNKIDSAPVPAGAPASAVSDRDQAVGVLRTGLNICLGNLANEPRSVMGDILRDLSQGYYPLVRAEQAINQASA
jgi:hypothetical protein